MKEIAQQFGSQAILSGVVTIPEKRDKTRPALIILNSGVRHHVGCCRMSVKLARAVAEHGVLTLRFDLSGIGDSPLRNDSLPYEQSSVEEAISAMDFLEQTLGINKFVFYGLCSGAYLGFKVAQLDTRVIGVAQVDGYAYRTPRFYFKHYTPRLFDKNVWRNLIFHRIPNMIRKSAGVKASRPEFEIQEWPDPPSKAIVEKGYRLLVERRLKMLMFYTGGVKYEYNYQNQFFDMFSRVDFADLVTLSFLPDASHILREQESQDHVTDFLVRWIDEFHCC
ncbi:MAG: hypothetical protein CSA49_05775 [Gammaproteobacteria bacterium]|nr:MAG: hypothetical protein CSA49_05775 [Gammaproteobacteria bacterium]